MATKDQLIASAQKNLEKGQIQKAIKDYQALLQLEPKVDQHKQKLADLLCRVNLKAEAQVLYDSLAKGYAERGFYAKAIAVYKQIQRIDPANTDSYLRLAELNRSLGLIGNAMSEYRSLLEFFEKRNLVSDATVVLQRMVELEPENLNLHSRLLPNLLKEKAYDKVKDTILKVCEICRKSGDTVKSQKLLQTILSDIPEKNDFHLDLANRLNDGGFYADAIIVIQFLLKSSPQDLLLINQLASLYGKVGDSENELLLLGQMLSVQPSVETADRLVRLCIESGDYARALSELEAHEATLDDESHAVVIELYELLGTHLPGNQRVRNAIVRFFGGTPSVAATEEEFLTVQKDVPASGRSSERALTDSEFELPDLLSPLPQIGRASCWVRVSIDV